MIPQDFEGESADTGRLGVLSGLVKLIRVMLVLIVMLFGVIYFWPPFKDREAALQKLDELNAKRDELKQRAVMMEQKLDLIQNDSEYLEAMARDRLNLQKDGEIIVRFEDPPPSGNRPPNPAGAAQDN